MIAFDSNVLIYAQQEADGQDRHLQAMELISVAILTGAVIPLQVLGEFLNVCRIKLGHSPDQAVGQVEDYLQVFECPETTANDLTEAAFLADNCKLQFFDALIIAVAERSGATALLSEDMHDGLKLGRLVVLNPFNPANAEAIAALFLLED